MCKIMRIAFLLSFSFSISIFFAQDLYKFKKGNKEGFIDASGNIVISPIYDDVDDFSENLAKVKIGSKYGYINLKGEQVVAIKYLENFIQ